MEKNLTVLLDYPDNQCIVSLETSRSFIESHPLRSLRSRQLLIRGMRTKFDCLARRPASLALWVSRTRESYPGRTRAATCCQRASAPDNARSAIIAEPAIGGIIPTPSALCEADYDQAPWDENEVRLPHSPPARLPPGNTFDLPHCTRRYCAGVALRPSRARESYPGRTRAATCCQRASAPGNARSAIIAEPAIGGIIQPSRNQPIPCQE